MKHVVTRGVSMLAVLAVVSLICADWLPSFLRNEATTTTTPKHNNDDADNFDNPAKLAGSNAKVRLPTPRLGQPRPDAKSAIFCFATGYPVLTMAQLVGSLYHHAKAAHCCVQHSFSALLCLFQCHHRTVFSHIQCHHQGDPDSMVNTVGVYISRHGSLRSNGFVDNVTMEVLNFDGSVSPVVHQFDRDDEMKAVVDQRAHEYLEHWKAMVLQQNRANVLFCGPNGFLC